MIPASGLLDRRLLVLAGKGGVGRTVVASALALVAARRGKRVLLAQTKGKERLSQLFGVKRVGADLARLGEGLWAVAMTPEAALREYGGMVLRSEFLARQVLENRVSRTFLKAVPGLEDYSMLGKVWWHTTEELEGGRPRWDLVVLDGPATGHLLQMLSIPLSILDSVPEGPLSRPAAATVALLRDPARAALVPVTLAEDLPVSETLELWAKQRATVGMSAGPLVVNQLYPGRFSEGPSQRALAALPEHTADPVIDPLLSAARTIDRRRALNERQLARLAETLPAFEQIRLPRLFTPSFGRPELDLVAAELERRL